MTHDYEYDYDLDSKCCGGPVCVECQTVRYLRDDKRWYTWANWQPCSDNATAWRTIDSTYEAEMKGVKFPSCIRDQDVIDTFLHPEFCTFPTDVQSITETTEDDPCKFKNNFHALGQKWQDHVELRTGPSEAAMRSAADFIISIAFGLQRRPRLIYVQEARLVLPHCDDTSSPFIAVADGLVFTALDTARFPFPPIGGHFVFQWSDSDAPWRRKPISFVFEAGSASKSGITTYRQLVTYFTAALKHRRAVGMKDAPLYGATLLGDQFTLYVAVWQDDKIVVHPTGHVWVLFRAIEFIDCYLHLCALARLISHQVEESLQAPKEDIERARQKAIDGPWRSAGEKPADDSEMKEEDDS